MADDSEQGSQEPDLALPKLFGRKKKDKPAEAAQAEPTPEPEPEPEPTPATEAFADESTRRLPPVPPPAQTAPPVEPPPEVVPAPEPPPEVVPAPEPPPEVVPAPEPPPDVVPAPEPPPDVVPAPEPPPAPATPLAPEPPAEPVLSTPKPPRERKPLRLPRINPYLAALVTGAVCGLVAVLLEIVTQRGCETVRGVGSCGGLGLVALLVILAVVVGVGAVLLRAFGVTDPTSTSFLGVGIVAVLALVFFLGSIDSVWMFLVLPALTAVTFAISYWVTDSVVAVPKDEDKSTTVT